MELAGKVEVRAESTPCNEVVVLGAVEVLAGVMRTAVVVAVAVGAGIPTWAAGAGALI